MKPMQDMLDELRILASRAENRRTETGIPRVAMVRGAVPEHQLAAVYEPMINLTLQGSKSMTIGDRTLHYDPATYFVMSIELPAIGRVYPAANGDPYLAISLTLTSDILARLLADLPSVAKDETEIAGFSVASVTPELMDAWVRMLRLMDRPADMAALAPIYEREILYRVLQGPQGNILRQIAAPDNATARIRRAIKQIRREFDQPLRVESLAETSAMSVSAFHRHFKAVTTLSPLQYQKNLRLLQNTDGR